MPAQNNLAILVHKRLPWRIRYSGEQKCDREKELARKMIVEMIAPGDTALLKRQCQLCGDFHERLATACDDSDFADDDDSDRTY